MNKTEDTALRGKQYWRSLDHLAETPEFKEMVAREFPEGASELSDPVSRRKFLSLMGASMALAGLTSCRRPVEKIIPYVTRPEEITPGIPKYFATQMPFGLESYGLLVKSHEGRPTKIEGNPEDPVTNGKSNAWMQAEMLNLYDPDRLQSVRRGDRRSSWTAFEQAWRSESATLLESDGEGLALLLEPTSSPSMKRLVDAFKKRFPKARVVVYSPVNEEAQHAAVEKMTGAPGLPVYDFENADVILSLDADFLQMEAGSLVNSRGFGKRRQVESTADDMNRLYAVESTLTLTGGMADHRLRVKQGDIEVFTLALALEFQKQGLDLGLGDALPEKLSHPFNARWLKAVAEDLRGKRGHGLILAGRSQPSRVHALVAAMNLALGNTGKTVTYRHNPDWLPSQSQALAGLVEDISAGTIQSLIILGGNPVYTVPTDLKFNAGTLTGLRFSAYLGHHADETAAAVMWQLPRTHFLEAWGDVSGHGHRGVVQPLIAPLFDGRSDLEVLGLLVSDEPATGYNLVRETWQNTLNGDFEKAWRRVLHDGVFVTEVSKPLGIGRTTIRKMLETDPLRSSLTKGLEVSFRPSFSNYDGRYANNGWMQELPDPITKITWDNAALMSERTARKLGFENEQLVKISTSAGEVILPVWIQPGQAEDSIALELGFGREAAGRIGTHLGGNVFRLRRSSALHSATGVDITRVGGDYRVACVQDHHGVDAEALAAAGIQERLPDLVREATLAEYRENPEFAHGFAEEHDMPSMWKDHEYDEPNQWGMSIDLNACIGCSACTIACQSENNIPVIGKEEVLNGREMSWLRMDRYYSGDVDEPEMVVQPVGCQHCEMAPCEQVCPVAATTHSDEGLNQMAYNRCVGTRYCANNCPYKVRRFNFFNYTKDLPEIIHMAQNPDVTVRFRGVMEKCSYCVQRIEVGRITAKNEGRELADGDVVSACQQACPTDAIVFGNIADPESRVAKVKQQNRDYALLGFLNTRPRTSYLAKLRNPNPKLAKQV